MTGPSPLLAGILSAALHAGALLWLLEEPAPSAAPEPVGTVSVTLVTLPAGGKEAAPGGRPLTPTPLPQGERGFSDPLPPRERVAAQPPGEGVSPPATPPPEPKPPVPASRADPAPRPSEAPPGPEAAFGEGAATEPELSAGSSFAAGPSEAARPAPGNPPPAYPMSARRRGQEGRVVLRVSVTASGTPDRIELVESSGSDALDRAAQEAVRSWRFVPARRDGKPVAGVVDVPVRFRLRDG